MVWDPMRSSWSRSLDRRALDDLHVHGQPAVERLDARLAHRGGGVAVPRAWAVCVVSGGDTGPNGVNPALELSVVGLSEAFPEAGGDLATPVARRTLAQESDIEPDHGAALFGNHLGAHLVGHTGRDEQLNVDVLTGRGSHDGDLGGG